MRKEQFAVPISPRSRSMPTATAARPRNGGTVLTGFKNKHMTYNVKIRVFADNLVGLGLLHSVSYTRPTMKHNLMWEKVAQNATFNLFFFPGWGVRRIQNNIYMFSNPTEIGKS